MKYTLMILLFSTGLMAQDAVQDSITTPKIESLTLTEYQEARLAEIAAVKAQLDEQYQTAVKELLAQRSQLMTIVLDAHGVKLSDVAGAETKDGKLVYTLKQTE